MQATASDLRSQIQEIESSIENAKRTMTNPWGRVASLKRDLTDATNALSRELSETKEFENNAEFLGWMLPGMQDDFDCTIAGVPGSVHFINADLFELSGLYRYKYSNHREGWFVEYES